ncbi:MAG TPA: MFS transporter, partial [Planctomycetota bacterium]|nr:MFS transporter [Planctomycetota bacterium]
VQIRRGLGVSILAGAVGAVFYTQAGVLSLLFAGLALELHVSNPLMSVLVATLPLAATAEIVMAYLIHRTGRRQEFFAWGLILSRLLWLPIVLIPYYVPAAHPQLRVTALFALLMLSSVLTVAGGNAWGSWMGDLIPATVLGRYFGFRQIFTVLTQMLTGVLVGVYLDYHTGFGGYVAVISMLLVFGIVDVVLFWWVPHPPMQRRDEKHTLIEMLRVPLADARYRKAIAFFALWTFTTGLLAPYIGIFQRGEKYAAMSFTTGYVYGAVAGLCLVVTSYYWGRLADRWNAKKVLFICLLIAVPPPFCYLFATPERTWPILLAIALGNVGWGGIFVVSIQMIIGLAPAKDRSMYLACQSAVMGVVMTVTYLAAGGIVKLLANVTWTVGPYTWRDLHILFLISGVLRLACLLPVKSLETK